MTLERHRCAHCRNPIRNGKQLPAGSAGAGESWFHSDCWASVQAAKQEDYHRRIQAKGLDALFAPYVVQAAAATVVGLPAQATPIGVDTLDSRRGAGSGKPGVPSQPTNSVRTINESDIA